MDGGLDGADTSGDGSVPEASADVAARDGLLANTGSNGTVLLVLGGLLSVAAGVTAWQPSRRRSAMN